MAHSAAYKDGECLLNLIEVEEFAKNDERKAEIFQKEFQKKEDEQKKNKNDAQMQKMMAASSENFAKMREAKKSLKD